MAVDDATSAISATLNLNCTSTDIAEVLNLKMVFYQNGILRATIEEPDSTRFKISEHDLPVVDE